MADLVLTDPVAGQTATAAQQVANNAAIKAAVNTLKHLVFNVQEYGALGDGVTDDTVAVQAAITAAALVHGTVFFPPGTYKITAALVLPSGGGYQDTGSIIIQGAGRNGSKISQATANTAIFTTGGAGAFTQSVTIRDLMLEYAAQASTTDTLSYAIGFAGVTPLATSFLIERCWINRAYVGIGISATSGSVAPWNLRVVDTWITSTRHNAVKLVSPVAVGMPSNYFQHLYVANTGVGGIGGTPIVSDGSCFTFTGASVVMHDIDVEGWYNTAVTYNGNPQALVAQGIYFEHHIFDNTSPYVGVPVLFDFASDAVVDGLNVSATVNNVGAFMFNVNNANLHVRGASSSLTFTGGGYAVGFLTGGTTSRIYYDRDWKANLGAINLPDLAGGASDALAGGARTLAYSATIATDASVASDIFRVIATNGTAFTLSSPTNATTGRQITYDLLNSSGGAMGVVTWGATFKLAGAFTNPANGKRRTISFYYDGTNWIETNRAAADI